MELVIILLVVFVLALAALRRAQPVQPQVIYVYTPSATESVGNNISSAFIILIIMIVGGILLFSA